MDAIGKDGFSDWGIKIYQQMRAGLLSQAEHGGDMYKAWGNRTQFLWGQGARRDMVGDGL